MRALREYQQLAVDEIRADWTGGVTRTAIVLPTGCGKSTILGKLAVDEAQAGGRVLVLCHLAEALDQITKTCHELAPGVPVGRVQSSTNQTRRPITTAMVQTLAHERRRGRMPRPTMVIVDEAHHAVSPRYMEVLTWAKSFDHVPTLGVTATMVRGDGRGLGDVWQNVCFTRDVAWAVNEGWLVRPRGRVVVADHMKLDSAKISRGDYQSNELGDMISMDTDQIVKSWLEHAADRITVAFTPNVQSATDLRDEFLRFGISAELVVGGTKRPERNAIYERLAAGTTRVLVSVMVTTESWDCPPVSCVLQCRPTKLPGLYTQMVGRALRPYPGKVDALVLDVVGASRHQRLVTLVDLHPSAEFDTSELDALPCEDCGHQPCICPPAERDPDGGRIKLLGPAEFEDHDFFATSQLNWLFTHGGVRFLPAGDRMALLWPEGDLYIAGHRTTRGYEDGRWIGPDGHWDPAGPLPLNEARQRAEAWALAVDPSVASRGSSWRKFGGSPSDKQIAMALRCGVENPETMNKGRLSDEISIALASRVLD